MSTKQEKEITPYWKDLEDAPRIDGEVWLSGDIHADRAALLNKLSRYKIRDAHVIVLGDCGVGFGDDSDRHIFDYLNRGMEARNNHVYLIRGNHDNPSFWSPERSKEIHDKYTHVTLLPQGPLWINDELFYVFPGGVSIDRIAGRRKEGWSYWKAEEVQFADILPAEHPPVKGVLAHVGPTPDNLSKGLLSVCLDMDPELQKDLNKERDTVAEVIRRLDPEIYVYGHFHRAWQCRSMRPKLRALDICEVIHLDQEH